MPDYPDHFLAAEALIRRASQLGLPFMLKGSYLTRQYFPDPADRLPQDLDWLALERYPKGIGAQTAFNHWLKLATELPSDDGILFYKAAFWQEMEYMMTEDFPTVSTNIQYRLASEPDADTRPWYHHDDKHFQVDVSFNLPMDLPGEPLLYQPLVGEPFVVPHTPPLALQVAWKLHQTLVRPRFKDLFDLLHLVRHPRFTDAVREQALAALRQECQADATDVGRLHYLLAGRLEPLGTDMPVTERWQQWRHGESPHRRIWLDYERAADITDAARLPAALPDFAQQLRETFALAGFDAAQLPEPDAAAPAAITGTRFYYEELRDLLT